MNFAESLKSVLKNKTQNIFTDFWNYDLKVILLDLTRDFSELAKAGTSSLHYFKREGIKSSLKESFESGSDVLLILRILPKRMKEGFTFFKDDFLEELEKQTDKKQKSIFGLKVIGALTSFTANAFYNVKKGKATFAVRGLRRHNAFTKFIVAELIFKITQHFIYRFLHELEKELTDPVDLNKIRYFKDLVSSRSEVEDELIEGDKAIEIVENLKVYIMTGKRDRN